MHKFILSIIILASLLRFYGLGDESLWIDEYASIRIAEGALVGEAHPPLYYSILHLFLFFGRTEFIARLPSAIFGILSIPLLYLVGKRIFQGREALLAAFLLSFAPMHVAYSQEARMYSIFMFFALSSIYFFLSQNKWARIGFVLTTVLGFYTHYFMAFVLAAEVSYCVIQRNTRLLFPFAIISLSILPLLPIFLSQVPVALGLPLHYGMLKQDNYLSTFTVLSTGFTGDFLVSLPFILLFLSGLFSRNSFLYLWFFPVIGAGYFLAGIMCFHWRYFIFILPAYLLLVSCGIIILSGKIRKKIAVILLVGVLVAGSIFPLQTWYLEDQKTNLRKVSKFIQLNEIPGDAVIPLGGSPRLLVDYYYNNSSSNTLILHTNGTLTSLLDVLSRSNRSWIVVDGNFLNFEDEDGEIRKWLAFETPCEEFQEGTIFVCFYQLNQI